MYRPGRRPAFVLAAYWVAHTLAWLCRSGGDAADVELGDQFGVVEHVDRDRAIGAIQHAFYQSALGVPSSISKLWHRRGS